MLLTIGLIILGLVVLLSAGDVLVRGAVGLATALKIPALIVSLTIVAFGTSAPELIVSINAVLSGNAGIALGNIIGSNIANVLLVIGLPAIIYPMSTKVDGLRRHALIMLIATAAFAAIAYGRGAIDHVTGPILFAAIMTFVGYMWLRAQRCNNDDSMLDEVAEYAEGNGLSLRTILYIVVGLIGLPLGAHLLVSNGASLAASLGVRDEIIGLTIVAFGTSLPELATVAAAAVQKKSDVAIGGIVGSNIFNLLAVGGAAGITGTAVFATPSLSFDLPIMVLSSVILAGYIFTRRDIGRFSGFLMFAGYISFIAAIAVKAAA